MAESKKGTSSSTDPKEKKSFFDDEIGKEFFGPWKSMSAMEDDKIDFNFDKVSTGKKKTFNFDKLDIDFDLGGDFAKLSSFNVDMPDLDFPSSSKKAAKPKERSEQESSKGNCEGEKDPFPFNFNDLHNFDFDSTLTKVEKASVKNLDIDVFTSERSEYRGSRINQSGFTDACDDGQTKKAPTAETVTTSTVEITVAGVGTDNSLHDNLPSSSRMFDDVVVSRGARASPEKTVIATGEETDKQSLHGARSSPEKAITASARETDQQSCSPEKAVPTEPHAAQTTQRLPVHYLSKNDLTGDSVSEVEFEVGSPGTKVNIESDAEQTVSERLVDVIGPNHETSQAKNSDTLLVRATESNRDNNRSESEMTDGEMPTDNILETEPGADNLDLETASATSLSQTVLQDCHTNNDIQNSTSKLSVALGSENVVDKRAPIKEKESEVVHSKFLRRSTEPKPQLHHPSSVVTKDSSFGNKVTSAMQLSHVESRKRSVGTEVFSAGNKVTSAIHISHPENGKREGLTTLDAKLGRKLVGYSKSPFRELPKGESTSLGSEKNFTTLCNIRDSLDSDSTQNGCKLVVDSRPATDKEVPKGDSVLLGSKMKNKENHNFSCEVNPARSTDMTTNSSAQTSKNSRVVISSMVSMRNSKMISVEGLKARKKTPDLSKLKISQTLGENKVQSNATLQKDVSPFRNSEKIREGQGNTASRILLPLAIAEKKTPVIPSLKRKTFEAINAADQVPSIPHKRLSLSPRENRSFKEPSEKVVDHQVCNPAESRTRTGLYNYPTSGLEITQEVCNPTESRTRTALYHHPTSGLEITQELNMKELEVPSAIEDDGNVEKAEAYAKELEDICNMLKKKHEEAKEILVRAIVTNNSLLMLNHPIFDEKIHMVEKFAVQLTLK